MTFSAQMILELLKAAADKAKVSINYANLGVLSDRINDHSEHINDHSDKVSVSQTYLYNNLYRPAQKAVSQGEDVIGLNTNYIRPIAIYLGHKDFNDFVDNYAANIPEQLVGLQGNWYSYVRDNSGLPNVLRSPVKIYLREKTIIMELHGPQNVYIGELRILSHCLSCTLVSGNERILHLIFKIGVNKKGKLLQGVFCGINSAANPIAGRELLVRLDEDDFQQLTPQKIPIEEKQSEFLLDRRIIKYFKTYQDNNLKISDVSTFSLEDIE